MSEKIEKKDLVELYDWLQSQLVEDREKIVDLYDSLKNQVSSREDYAIHGLTLSKFAEIMVKQTSQLLEIIRINQKEIKKDDFNLNDDDKKFLFKKIGNG